MIDVLKRKAYYIGCQRDEVQERKVVTMVKAEKLYDCEATFTIGQLKELLSKYEDTDLVNIYGGEDGSGDFWGVIIGESEDDLY